MVTADRSKADRLRRELAGLRSQIAKESKKAADASAKAAKARAAAAQARSETTAKTKAREADREEGKVIQSPEEEGRPGGEGRSEDDGA
ncbi:MAG: hypothetical protein ACREA0_19510 [bacterium]